MGVIVVVVVVEEGWAEVVPVGRREMCYIKVSSRRESRQRGVKTVSGLEIESGNNRHLLRLLYRS